MTVGLHCDGMSTSGDDGTVLLIIYIILAAAVVLAATVSERRAGEAAGPPPDPDELDEYEIAFLTGGAELAAVVALVNLDRREAIDLGDGLLRELQESGDLDLGAVRDADHLAELGVELHVSPIKGTADVVSHPVETAALQAVLGTKPRTPWRVVSVVSRTRALRQVRDGLVHRGLVHSPADTERLPTRWRWLLPVLAVGALLALDAGGSGRPVWPLAVAILATVAAMAALARHRPANTRRGDLLLAELRRRRAELLEEPVATSASPGMVLALTGTGGLWAADRALALAVAAPSPPAEASSLRDRREARSWRHLGGGSYAGGWWGGAGCGGGGGWGDVGGGGDGGGGGGCGGSG